MIALTCPGGTFRISFLSNKCYLETGFEGHPLAESRRLSPAGSQAQVSIDTLYTLLSGTTEEIAKPEHRAGELKERELVSRGLLEASSESAEAFELMEEDFNPVPVGVPASIEMI